MNISQVTPVPARDTPTELCARTVKEEHATNNVHVRCTIEIVNREGKIFRRVPDRTHAWGKGRQDSRKCALSYKYVMHTLDSSPLLE